MWCIYFGRQTRFPKKLVLLNAHPSKYQPSIFDTSCGCSESNEISVFPLLHIARLSDEQPNQRIAENEQACDAFSKVNDNVQHIMKVRGIGPQTAISDTFYGYLSVILTPC